MNVLVLTDEGKLSINDYRPLDIRRAILETLSQGQMTIHKLITTIKENYKMFKYTKINIMTRMIGELVNQKLIEDRYSEDFL